MKSGGAADVRCGVAEHDERAPALPWRSLILLAALGTLLGTALTLADLSRTRDTNGGLAHTGPDGPAADLMARDFPDEPQFTYGEHDGPMFYAVARDPWDLDTAAESLDRPRYRLQHPLFPWSGWLVHPTGGGDALLWSMFGVGVAAMFASGLASGALSATLRGPLWVAALAPVVPGATVSLRITVADTLAVALALAAVTASLRSRPVAGALLAVAAVLTKEPMILAFAGVALWRRDREGVLLVGLPVAVAGLWAAYLHGAVDTKGGEVIEFGLPFKGLIGAIDIWRGGSDPYALVAVVAAIGLGIAALVRRPFGHPLWGAVAFNLAFVLLLNKTVVGLERNGTRMTMPLLLLGLIAVVAPRPGLRLPQALDRPWRGWRDLLSPTRWWAGEPAQPGSRASSGT